MTVAIASQRFLAIKYPFKYGRKNNRQVPKYVACVSILALIATISTFFEFKVEHISFDVKNQTTTKLTNNGTEEMEASNFPTCICEAYGSLDNYTDYQDLVQNQTMTIMTNNDTEEMGASIYFRPTDMKESVVYKAYEAFGVLVIFGIIPFVLLISFYIGIYMEIKANNSRIGNLTASKASKDNKKKEATLARTFGAFVVTFFICYTPQHIFRIYESALFNQTLKCGRLPHWASYAREITQMFIVLNSAINVVIYTVVNDQFRTECKKMFRKLRGIESAPATKTTDTGIEIQKTGHDCT